MARAGAGRTAVEDSHRRAPCREPPGNGKSDHPRADDGDVWLARIGGRAVRQPAAPFAGMTQTEVQSGSMHRDLRCQTARIDRIGAKELSGGLSNLRVGGAAPLVEEPSARRHPRATAGALTTYEQIYEQQRDYRTGESAIGGG